MQDRFNIIDQIISELPSGRMSYTDLKNNLDNAVLRPYILDVVSAGASVENLDKLNRMSDIICWEKKKAESKFIIDAGLYAIYEVLNKIEFGILRELDISVWQIVLDRFFELVKKVIASDFDGNYKNKDCYKELVAVWEPIVNTLEYTRAWRKLFP